MVVVSQLLEKKGRQIWSIAPDASVYDALKLMAEKRIGALLVLEGEHLVGVMSERDYARKIILEGRSSRDTQVRDIMTSKVFCVNPENKVEECMALMTDKGIRHLPVIDGGRLCGLVSIGDVVKTVISEQEFVIEQLEQFITGR